MRGDERAEEEEEEEEEEEQTDKAGKRKREKQRELKCFRTVVSHAERKEASVIEIWGSILHCTHTQHTHTHTHTHTNIQYFKGNM